MIPSQQTRNSPEQSPASQQAQLPLHPHHSQHPQHPHHSFSPHPQPSQHPPQSHYAHQNYRPHPIRTPFSPVPSRSPSRPGSTPPLRSPHILSPFQQHPPPPTLNPVMRNRSSDSSMSGVHYLHPLQMADKVRETHSAFVERDMTTGRKFINQYEVIEEIGRGVHGKVKLARVLDTGENVAIKIIPRFSKTRRLGKVTANSPLDKTKREIAILKKVRHPNVVALLEIIDDPELKKIYMVLEHVELGEVVWRKKGLPHICQFERQRVERAIRGETPSVEEQQYERLLQQQHTEIETKSTNTAVSRLTENAVGALQAESLLDEAPIELDTLSLCASLSVLSTGDPGASASVAANASSMPSASVTPSRSCSPWRNTVMSEPGYMAGSPTTMGPPLSAVFEGVPTEDTSSMRARSPSDPDSVISHMSAFGVNPVEHDAFTDDFSYVPCFTIEQARLTFRDTVLGLEYLHFQGIIHRDIKPANLLRAGDQRVKISDFGVSYFGRPFNDGEPESLVSESEAHDFDDELELAKTVGTPAFFAPELCYVSGKGQQPRISEQIDVWSLGVTLYCIIFGRLPFLGEDEFQMFRTIATRDVYIPDRRLCPVNPSTSPVATSLFHRVGTHPYRDDNALDYEDIDPRLCDLMRRMLTKDPEKRIRLAEVKRHPWTIDGIPPSQLSAWLADTDPRRQACGQKIQVDEKEIKSAIVPLTLLERAKSVVRKTYNKMVHGRSRSPSSRRWQREALSTGNITCINESQGLAGLNNATPRDISHSRSVSKPEDNAGRDAPHAVEQHPLSQSITMMGGEPTPKEATISPLDAVGSYFQRLSGMNWTSSNTPSPDATAEQSPVVSLSRSSSKARPRHGYTRSITNAFMSLAPALGHGGEALD